MVAKVVLITILVAMAVTSSSSYYVYQGVCGDRLEHVCCPRYLCRYPMDDSDNCYRGEVCCWEGYCDDRYDTPDAYEPYRK